MAETCQRALLLPLQGAAIVTLGMPFVLPPPAAAIYGSPSSDDNFENIPGTLSSSSQEDGSKQLSNLLGGKNGKQVQGCTRTVCLHTMVSISALKSKLGVTVKVKVRGATTCVHEDLTVSVYTNSFASSGMVKQSILCTLLARANCVPYFLFHSAQPACSAYRPALEEEAMEVRCPRPWTIEYAKGCHCFQGWFPEQPSRSGKVVKMTSHTLIFRSSTVQILSPASSFKAKQTAEIENKELRE
eukprot:843774-Pelagomonas_calceolata.AAC.1